jgi:hypothetical protein
MPKALDLTGKTKGRLTALYPIKKRNNSGRIVWKFQCKCGNKPEISAHDFRSGKTCSCGCLQLERIKIAKITHGMRNTRTYKTWASMIQRCENLNDSSYKDYGGRGIKVCERWHKFENFLANMGNRPESLTLDRWPDNDGSYEPGNCRWATTKEQRANSRPISCGPAKQSWFRAWREDSMVQYLSNNQHEFARKWNLSRGDISSCLYGRYRQHKGWKFEFLKSPNSKT